MPRTDGRLGGLAPDRCGGVIPWRDGGLVPDTDPMTRQGRGAQAKADPQADFLVDLRSAFEWRADRFDRRWYADSTGWWADPSILGRLGPALARLFVDERPTVVLGPQSRGAMLGALVAVHLGVGLVELRKDPVPLADSDRWLTARTPPDYRNRNLLLGARRKHLGSAHRALFVDDWIDTGGQTIAARSLVEQAGATWCGAAVIVDALRDRRLRHELDVRCLTRSRDL